MDIDASRAQRLFQAVVTQCLIDATTPPTPKQITAAKNSPVKRRKKENDIEYAERKAKTINRRIISLEKPMREARSWLLDAGASFAEVVTLAGYNPDDIHERATALSANGWRPALQLAA